MSACLCLLLLPLMLFLIGREINALPVLRNIPSTDGDSRIHNLLMNPSVNSKL